MAFIYLIACFIYFVILYAIIKDSPYKSAYIRGAAAAVAIWFIFLFFSQGLIVGFSGSSIDYPLEEVEGRIFITRITDWVSFLVLHISMPFIFKKLLNKQQVK